MQLTNALARQASKVVSFERLTFGTPEERLFSYKHFLMVVNETKCEDELNKWWRSVMPDARWKTHEEFRKEIEFKVNDIREYHNV